MSRAANDGAQPGSSDFSNVLARIDRFLQIEAKKTSLDTRGSVENATSTNDNWGDQK
jgi:hypothetical protein